MLAKYLFRNKQLLVLVCFILLPAKRIQSRGFTEVSFRFEIML